MKEKLIVIFHYLFLLLLLLLISIIQPDGDDFETRSCSLQPKLNFPLYFAQEFWQEIHDLKCVCMCVCVCVLGARGNDVCEPRTEKKITKKF